MPPILCHRYEPTARVFNATYEVLSKMGGKTSQFTPDLILSGELEETTKTRYNGIKLGFSTWNLVTITDKLVYNHAYHASKQLGELLQRQSDKIPLPMVRNHLAMIPSSARMLLRC